MGFVHMALTRPVRGPLSSTGKWKPPLCRDDYAQWMGCTKDCSLLLVGVLGTSDSVSPMEAHFFLVFHFDADKFAFDFILRWKKWNCIPNKSDEHWFPWKVILCKPFLSSGSFVFFMEDIIFVRFNIFFYLTLYTKSNKNLHTRKLHHSVSSARECKCSSPSSLKTYEVPILSFQGKDEVGCLNP